jgi:hypothetical protein
MQLTQDQERDAVIEDAIATGKFPASRAPVYARAWDAKPEATKRLIARMAAGLPPDAKASVPAPVEVTEGEMEDLFGIRKGEG